MKEFVQQQRAPMTRLIHHDYIAPEVLHELSANAGRR